MTTKVAVITNHRVKNYGSVLQAYATQASLEEIGASVEIVDYWRPDLREGAKGIMESRAPLAKKAIRLSLMALRRSASMRSRETFSSFVEANLNLSDPYYSLDDLTTNPPVADIFCTGSDQVWNTSSNGGDISPYLLSFAPKNSRKMSYSSSVGADSIAEKDFAIFRSRLQEYSFVSVREHEAQKLLAGIGIQSEVMLDPTLVAQRSIWPPLLVETEVPEDYILTYQLNRNRDFGLSVRAVAEELKLPVLAINPSSLARIHGSYADMEINVPPVGVFLSLLSRAKFVLTDSFHGTALSMAFNRQFGALLPPSYSSRITQLLRFTRTSHCLFESGRQVFPKREELLGMVDYSQVDPILEKGRDRALSLLSGALA